MTSALNLETRPQAFHKAFYWLLRSGIQDHSRDLAYRGGVNAWFDLKNQSYPFIYSEITGYAVNAFLFYHRLSCDPEYFHAAQLAADWLLRNTYPDCCLVRTRLNHPSFSPSYCPSWVFTFDQWVVVYALASLAEASGDTGYLEKAEEIAGILLRRTVREDGFFFPVFDISKGTGEEPGSKWSRQVGSFHAKAFLGLKKLETLTGKGKYRDFALKLFTKTLTLQQPDGRFPILDNSRSTHLHPHLYTLEGLLSFGLAEKNDRALAAAEKGLKWVLDHQLADGAIYALCIQDYFLPYIRTDVLAQALRVGLILLDYGFMHNYETHLKRLYQKLLGYQIATGPQEGGFLYGQEENGSVHPHVNAWVTMFAAQAIAICEYRQCAQDWYYDMSFFL